MINILILDDNANKAKKITDVLQLNGDCKIDSSSDLVSARKMLIAPYDLLILDMNLPERFNEQPKENNGVAFIDEIKRSDRLKKPSYIIGLSEYEELVSRYSKEFANSGFVLIKYEEKGRDWQQTLHEMVEHIRVSRTSINLDDSYDFDVAIITALRNPEFQSVLDLGYGWKEQKVKDDYSSYRTGNVLNSKGRILKIVATYLPQMGMVPCAVSAEKIMKAFRPKYLIMTGICGGVKGSVALGDVVISDSAFDLGSGKIVLNDDGTEGFEPDFKTLPLNAALKQDLLELSANKKTLREVNDSWKGPVNPNELRLHLGPLGSGSAVIANSNYINRIKKNQRKLIAIDMEGYAIFYTCQFNTSPNPLPIVIKSVCDFADHEKGDNIQMYCSHISVQIADHIIKNILSFE